MDEQQARGGEDGGGTASSDRPRRGARPRTAVLAALSLVVALAVAGVRTAAHGGGPGELVVVLAGLLVIGSSVYLVLAALAPRLGRRPTPAVVPVIAACWISAVALAGLMADAVPGDRAAAGSPGAVSATDWEAPVASGVAAGPPAGPTTPAAPGSGSGWPAASTAPGAGPSAAATAPGAGDDPHLAALAVITAPWQLAPLPPETAGRLTARAPGVLGRQVLLAGAPVGYLTLTPVTSASDDWTTFDAGVAGSGYTSTPASVAGRTGRRLDGEGVVAFAWVDAGVLTQVVARDADRAMQLVDGIAAARSGEVEPASP